MSYKKAKEGTDEWWQQKIDQGVIKARPGMQVCIICGIHVGKKYSICNNCP